MAEAKKYGSFSGVFTPSLLTILGVIMYLRLGWVVGQAGLYAALGIVVFAHIISIATGLSISSVATDKKIKTGGIYYILSRSLGFPMGGAIGSALTIGTALSISLYIIGFAENFLGIEIMRQITGLGNTINDFRLLGTVVIIILVVIAFISTSLAIKAQFFILAFIAISLISIAVGLYLNIDAIPAQPLLTPPKDAVSLDKVFAIFFPAVTGFTAGVAMSGDLKNAKKDIPSGTLLSIAVGFIVYVLLTVAFAFFVDPQMLMNDKNFVMKIAWFSPLVILGVWGATLSSALGGILGGPRILQAIAIDKIAPSFFAKGNGSSNEPRNALLFVFALAEIGILIGELDVIARIVSMFYLASYSFINLAFWLESWASTDFRPTFRVPKIIGLIGFLSCIGIMIFLDPLAMVISFLIMGTIYFILKRKQLRTDYGDVWQSVWTSIVRVALHRMDNQSLEQRNWQPNIILFSGNSQRRPHLLEFGKFIVGQYGMMSGFELHENKKSKILPKHEQSIPNRTEENKGVFTRRQTCRDIYEGIENIASTYGFSGIEPNTTLLGWARHTHNPQRFVEMINTLTDLDLNLLLVDYCTKKGFGNKKVIDIWWRGAGNNGNFALTLSKFICTSPEWRDAKIRLLIVNPNNEESPKISKRAAQIFDNLRINNAEIKILNNQIEQKSFYDIIRVESINTDLTFLGIPPKIAIGKESEFIERTNNLMQDIGTVVLLKSSSQFKKLKFGAQFELTKAEIEKKKELNLLVETNLITPELVLPENTIHGEDLKVLDEQLQVGGRTFYRDTILEIARYHNEIAQKLKTLLAKNLDNLYDKISAEKNKQERLNIITRTHSNVLIRAQKIIDELGGKTIEKQTKTLEKGISEFLQQLSKTSQLMPKQLYTIYRNDELKPLLDDSLPLLFFKYKNRLKTHFTGRKSSYTIDYQKLIDNQIPNIGYRGFLETQEKWGLICAQYVIELQKLIIEFGNSMMLFDSKIDSKTLEKAVFSGEVNRMKKLIERFDNLSQKSLQSILNSLINDAHKATQVIGEKCKQVRINRYTRASRIVRRKKAIMLGKLNSVPRLWQRNHQLFLNAAQTEFQLLAVQVRLRRIFQKIDKEIETRFLEHFKEKIDKLHNYLSDYLEKTQAGTATTFAPEEVGIIFSNENIFLPFKEVFDFISQNMQKIANRLPEEVEVLSEDSFNNFNSHQFEKVETIRISVSRLFAYIIQEEALFPFQRIADQLPVWLEKTNNSILDTLRLISFSVDHQEISGVDLQFANTPKNIPKFIAEQQAKIKLIANQVEEKQSQIIRTINERLNATYGQLSYYAFSKAAINLKQYIKSQEARNRLNLISTRILKARKFIANQVDQFWYRQSRTAIMTKQTHNPSLTDENTVNKFLDLLDSVSINKKMINKLPFYYQQLFLRKHYYHNEFWNGRQEQLEQANIAIERFRDGHYGGILIVGEQNSGKTFLSQYTVSQHFNSSDVYLLSPPRGGSVTINEFKQHLQSALRMKGNPASILKKMPQDSVIILDDLELWWEKSDAGFDVINFIATMIDKHSDKCLFIVNADIHAFRTMNSIKNIARSFISTIECTPVDAETLRNIILFRQQSSGLKLRITGKKNTKIGSSEYAALFTRHFYFSTGNIGAALFSWVTSITSFDGEYVEISLPKQPNFLAFELLTEDQKIFVLQLLLHRQMSAEKLARIMKTSAQKINSDIDFLRRSGIIVEHQNKIFEVNRFLYIHIKHWFEKQNIL